MANRLYQAVPSQAKSGTLILYTARSEDYEHTIWMSTTLLQRHLSLSAIRKFALIPANLAAFRKTLRYVISY